METRAAVQLLFAVIFAGAGLVFGGLGLYRWAGQRSPLGAVYLLTAAGAGSLALVLIWRLG